MCTRSFMCGHGLCQTTGHIVKIAAVLMGLCKNQVSLSVMQPNQRTANTHTMWKIIFLELTFPVMSAQYSDHVTAWARWCMLGKKECVSAAFLLSSLFYALKACALAFARSLVLYQFLPAFVEYNECWPAAAFASATLKGWRGLQIKSSVRCSGWHRLNLWMSYLILAFGNLNIAMDIGLCTWLKSALYQTFITDSS